MHISSSDLHPHLLARMRQRGVTVEEMEETLNHGWEASDVKPGTIGKVMVFDYEAEWEGQFYQGLTREILAFCARICLSVCPALIPAHPG